MTRGDYVWRVAAETREKNAKYKAPTANRYPQLLHDMSFVIGQLSNRATHDYLRLTMLPLPKRAYTMHKHLNKADKIVTGLLSLSVPGGAALL
jgi:hypothetical protein